MWVDLEDLKLLLLGAGEVHFAFPFEYDWDSEGKRKLMNTIDKYEQSIKEGES